MLLSVPGGEGGRDLIQGMVQMVNIVSCVV